MSIPNRGNPLNSSIEILHLF